MSKEYAVDSTKGHSMINPLNYKGDVLVQVWVDSRVLATLCGWLDSKGVYPVYLSQVVRRPLEVLTDVLVNSREVKLVDDTVEARTILQRRFKVDLSRGGRGTKNVMHNIELSIKREDLSESLHRENRNYDARKPMNQSNPETAALTEKGRRKYKELFPDKSKEVNHYDYSESKEVKRAYDSNKVVKSEDAAEFVKVSRERSEKDIPLLKEKGNSREVIEAQIRKTDEDSQKKLDALNNIDFTSLMASAVKEK